MQDSSNEHIKQKLDAVINAENTQQEIESCC